MAAHQPHKLEYVGSSPTSATEFDGCYRVVSVERHPGCQKQRSRNQGWSGYMKAGSLPEALAEALIPPEMVGA